MISPLVSFQAFHDFITVERVPAFVERSLTPVDKSLSILSPLEVFCDSKLINPFHGLFSPTKDSEFETQPTEAIVSAYSTADLQREIFKASARLLYYFSSSNFGLIFTRFKAKLLSFQGSSSENIADPEIFEFRMLEWFNFDRYRLGLFISEIHQFFPSLSNFAQGLASSLLTRAVMNWIDAYPGEYNALYRTKGRFEGAPDLMFDLLGQAAESTGRKAVFWPSMSALLCLCPETFVDMAKTTLTAETSFNRVHCTNAQGVYLTPTDRRRYFFDDLKFGIRSTILYESAAFCISTLLRGATVLSDHDQQLCHNLVNIFDEDCRAHVFNPKVLSYNPLGSDSDIFDLTIPASILANASGQVSAPVVEQYDSYPHLEMTTRILRIFVKCPMLVFSQRDGQYISFDDFRGFVATVCLGVLDMNRVIRTEASKLLSIMVEPKWISYWDESRNLQNLPEAEAVAKRMRHYWILTSTILGIIARHLIEFRGDVLDPTMTGIVIAKNAHSLIHTILTKRNVYLKQIKKEYATIGYGSVEHLAASNCLETLYLLTLAHCEPDVAQSAIKGIGLCIEELEYIQVISDGYLTQPYNGLGFVDNLSTYKDLVEELGQEAVIGQKALQKRIRTIIKNISHSTMATTWAFSEMYKRWRILTGMLVHKVSGPDKPAVPNMLAVAPSAPGPQGQGKEQPVAPSKPTPSITIEGIVPAARFSGTDPEYLEDNGQWVNYTGFLCTIGHTLTSNPTSLRLQRANPSSLLRTCRPRRSLAVRSPRFVTDMTELLVCDSKYVRGIAREHVGGSFSHSLCGKYRDSIGLINNYYLADNAASEDYVTGERALVFVEASIVALKTIFERSEEFGRMNNLVNFDFGQLITFFVPYLDRLHTKSSQAVALRVKCRLAQAVEQLVTHKYCLGLRQEIKFRNAMTRVFIDWNSDYSLLNEVCSALIAPYTEPTTVYSKQHRELDTACLKAMVVLLRHLPLQPVARPGASMTSISSDETKTKIFSSHLGFFLHVITTCNRVLEVSAPPPDCIVCYALSSNRRAGLWFACSAHVAPMRDSAVLCLSHLLSANIEIGLKYSLPLAYHRDLNIRMTFIQVLTTMLQDGTQKFSGLGEQASLIRDRYKMLLELILDSELTIVLGLCQVSNVTEVEDLAQTLMNVFSVRGEELPLLKAVITQDLSKTDSPHGFFRSNSVATRLWTIFARSVGAEYLQLAIQPILLDLVARNPPLEIELEKAGSAEIQRANIENIKEITEQLLDSIIRHINSIPPKFREICAHVSAALQKKFPDYPYVAVGTFLFLRFFCPAIVAPESHNLVQTISQRELRRGLVLITKALQHLANYAMFGVSNKENSIGILDEILKSNIGKVTWYLKELSSWSGATHEPLPAPNRMIKFPDYDLFALQRQLAVNIERMEATLAQNSVNPVLRRRRSTIGLQQPGNAPRRSSQGAIDVSGSDERLDAHMQKRWYYQQLSTILAQLDGARAIYEGGRSKSGRPVLYIIAKRCDLSDPEGIIHALNVELQPLTSLPFDILLDLSGFNTSSSDRSEALLYQLTNMLSYEVDLNCQQIIIYNMNSRAYQLHMATSHFIHPKVVSRLVYCSGLAELEEYIEPAHMKMPRDTFVEVKPSKFNFTTMVYSASSHNIGSFILTATDEHIVLTGTKKQPVFDSTVTVCNIIDFRDVVEIGRVGSSRTSESEFQISYVYQQQSVRGISHRQTFTESFSSSQRELIVRSLRAAKSRFDIANPVDHRLTPSRQLRPQDVPAVFLNISLMNLGSRNSLLKWISYDLLCKTTQAYGLSIEGLLVSPDLCLPTNVRDFLFNISKSIADKDNSIALDIVAEALTAFQQVGTRIKYHILAYIKPWLTAFGEIIPPTATLPDFRAVDEDLNVVKACDIFRIMVELSMVEIDMMPEIVHGFWAPFASVEEILPLLIDVVLEDSLRSGPFSPRTNTLTMIIMEVSVKNKPLVFGRILGRIRKALQYSSTTPARCLVDHPVFAEIMTLSRYILNLSFNDSHMARQYLPDLFHIVTCLLGLGPPLFRSTIHGIAVNVVQSLCTSTGHAHPNGPQLFQILKDFSESKLLTAFALSGYNHLQYQLGSTSVTVNFTANTRTGLGSSDNLMDVSREVLLTNLEDVFQTLLSALNLAAKDARQAAMWKSRWMSLVSGTAFVFNPALQPRTFVALGCLAGRDTDDDLLYQILVAFRGSLTLYEEFDVTLLVSCFMCMGNIVRLLSRNSRYLKVLFWIVLSAVMISHPPVFQAAASVLQILVRKLDESGAFDHAPMADVLLDAKIPAEEYFDKIEAAYGISFRSDFGFALTTVLLKGLKHPATKATTTLLFTTLLEVHTRNAQLHTFSPEGAAVMIETDRLYYMLPLLPFTENLKILLLSAGILDSNSIDDAGVFAAAPSDGEGGKDAPRKLRYQGILKAVQFTEPKSMMLTLALLMTMLDNAEYDSETLCILEALAECAKFMPGILSLLHDHLIPRAVQVISTSKNVKVVEVAQSILIVLMRHPQFGMINHGNIGGGFEQASLGAAAPSITTTLGALPDEFPPATYLAKLGFPGLLECGSFQSVHKKKRAQLVQLVLWLTEFWI
ncbi:uncharacterized protein BJ171DRAFT_423956 [Polychytrium aggregatum]|uniref:uncharacterized protein n=1 Tax=Polychytrium aggregatum TaxID=110093 RepID=UPI0022FEB050|nr:uncharacterized protein BJ171DRAFT_423956 [Polychytrium aggregatum]KAI9204553.1 hypothetical protein BJ171DRAFT_423956 [Polychytrium aggregatum]